MDERTLTALQGSIAKWEGIAKKECGDMASYNCPLCQLFNRNDDDSTCDGCPVKDDGNMYCDDTPYGDWCQHQCHCHREEYHKDESFAICAECVRLANCEVDYLKSLLPKDGE